LEFIVPGFFNSAGLELVHVPYRELAPAMNDLTEGRLHVYFSALASVLPQVRDGKLQALAVTSRERAASAPEVPTVFEAGYPDLLLDAFLGFFGSRDMPLGLRERIASEIGAVAADPALVARLATLGQAVRTSTPSELATRVTEEREKVAAIARTLTPTASR
jgi:tripartite-type tricarboxylate transporter receptor subunit TctC